MNFLKHIFFTRIYRIDYHGISSWVFFLIMFSISQTLSATEQSDFFSQLSPQKKIDTLIQLPYDVLVENFNRSEKWLVESIELNKDPLKEAILVSKKSIISYYQGKYEQSTSENLKAIKIYDSLGLKAEAGNQYAQLGYQLKRVNLDKSIMFMRKGIKIIESLNDSTNLSSVYGNYGVLKEMQGEIDSALFFYKKSLHYALITQDSIGIPYAYNRMAIGYMLHGDYKRSVDAMIQSSAIRNNRNDIHGMIENLSVLGDIYLYFKKYDLALIEYLKSLEGSNKLNYPFLVQENLYNISRCYAGLGDFEKAYEHYFQASNMKDSLLNEKTNQQIAQMQEQFESVKKDREILLLNSDNDLNKANLHQKNILIAAFSIGVVLLILLSFYIYRGYRIKKRTNEIIINQNQDLNTFNETLIQQKGIIELKNKEITDSIQYAKRIQSAILPPHKVVKEYLPESFILYKPKDIVAGDFYWMETVSSLEGGLKVGDNHPSNSHQGENIILFAAADCTGHGVPGAMVSVVCNNGLNRSVREHGLTDPGEILNKTREIVIQEFEKSDEDVKDGMDIALCSLEFTRPNVPFRNGLEVKSLEFDKEQHGTQNSNRACELNEVKLETAALLQYAGANNPLWIIRPSVIGSVTKQTLQNEQIASLSKVVHNDGNFELFETTANKQPIGKFDNPEPYTTHTFELQKGDSIYIFSDGYADQFGGEKGKKFKAKAFKNLLLNIQEKSMEEQRILIDETFETWKGNIEQVDDVCVIGVRV